MKRSVVALAALAASGCVGVSFYKEGTDPKVDTGLPFYQSKPYLLVTRSGAKDGGVESKIVYLPDTSQKYFAKYNPGILGNSQFAITLSDGRIVSFNQQVDSKLPELLGNLAAPLKGAGEAAVAFSTADLNNAQEDKLRAEFALQASQTKSADGVTKSATDSAARIFLNSGKKAEDASVCAVTPEAPLPSPNPELSSEQALQFTVALFNLICANELYAAPEVVKDKRDMVRNAIGSLALVYKQDFPRSQMALVLTILDKNATATTLRAIAKPLEAFDITNADKPSDAESQIENRVRTAAKRILELADKLDPPKPETPKDPFTLYEILVSPDGSTTLKKISQ